MAETPWLTIVGLGEDGPDGLSLASRKALARAEVVTGAARHLALLPDLPGERRPWPSPFAEGIEPLLALRGRAVVMLASGDPFWFGAGTTLARRLAPGEWVALPAPSTFGLAAARLGWALEHTACLGLHAAPLSRLRPVLSPGRRCLVLLRDGDSMAALAAYLDGLGFGDTILHVLEALGGPRERLRRTTASRYGFDDVCHPVAAGLEIAGQGFALPRAPGLPDTLFTHDGQITRRPIRALTLSALAPRPGALLWDIGAGAGSIAIEWLLSDPTTEAMAFEADSRRAARARSNALSLGVDRLKVIEGRAPDILSNPGEGARKPPDAVFIGGGLSLALLERLWTLLPSGVRVVANAVTLESESLLATWHDLHGGSLLRLELSEAEPLGRKRGWRAARPIVQWSGHR